MLTVGRRWRKPGGLSSIVFSLFFALFSVPANALEPDGIAVDERRLFHRDGFVVLHAIPGINGPPSYMRTVAAPDGSLIVTEYVLFSNKRSRIFALTWAARRRSVSPKDLLGPRFFTEYRNLLSQRKKTKVRKDAPSRTGQLVLSNPDFRWVSVSLPPYSSGQVLLPSLAPKDFSFKKNR